MPHRDFFSCLRESDQDFYERSGWVHQKGAAIYLPDDVIIVLPYSSKWFYQTNATSALITDYDYRSVYTRAIIMKTLSIPKSLLHLILTVYFSCFIQSNPHVEM